MPAHRSGPLRTLLEGFYNGKNLVVILCGGERAASEGKFLFGRHALNPDEYALVYDPGCEFHKDIAVRYHFRPLGGGWLSLDHRRKTIHIHSRSQAYGREPDRRTTARALERALPGYSCTAEL